MWRISLRPVRHTKIYLSSSQKINISLQLTIALCYLPIVLRNTTRYNFIPFNVWWLDWFFLQNCGYVVQDIPTESPFISQYIPQSPSHTLWNIHCVRLWKILLNLLTPSQGMRVQIHWASKETYNFLEWCPLKSTASKWMIFGLMLAIVLLITHVKTQRNRKCQKLDKCLQITTSPFFKITETAPFPPRRLSNTSIAIHSNSIAGYVIIFTIGLLYSKPIVNMSCAYVLVLFQHMLVPCWRVACHRTFMWHSPHVETQHP